MNVTTYGFTFHVSQLERLVDALNDNIPKGNVAEYVPMPGMLPARVSNLQIRFKSALDLESATEFAKSLNPGKYWRIEVKD